MFKIKKEKKTLTILLQLHNFLPKFEYGDITLKFKDETLYVYKALLSLHSNYMGRNFI